MAKADNNKNKPPLNEFSQGQDQPAILIAPKASKDNRIFQWLKVKNIPSILT